MYRLPLAEVDALVREHYLTAKPHPELPLTVLDYTMKTHGEGRWTPLTTMCRGLVIDEYGWIVSRPLPKFHHWHQIELPAQEPLVYDKVDGSLIVVSNYQGRALVNSRSSFGSDHARAARELLGDWRPDPDSTYCFELIHPKHRIVCDYGDRQELVLLAKIETATGREAHLADVDDWPGSTATEYELPTWPPTDFEQFAGANREGFVLHWPDSGLRAKVKFEEYVRLHFLFTGLNDREIWRRLRDGQDFTAILSDVPDEFHQWVHDRVRAMTTAFQTIEREAEALAAELIPGRTPKELALALGDHPLRHYVFRISRDQPFRDLIWKELYPERSLAYWNSHE